MKKHNIKNIIKWHNYFFWTVKFFIFRQNLFKEFTYKHEYEHLILPYHFTRRQFLL